MQLTKDILIKLISEGLEHGGMSCGESHPEHTHSEWEDHKKEEEKKTKSMAKISIKTLKKMPKKLSEDIPTTPSIGGGDSRIEAAKAKCKEKGGVLAGDECQDKDGNPIPIGGGLRENDSNSVSKPKVQKLYTNWKPTTDEGKLYKKQLGKVLGK
jgi:hypothetical protein